MALSLISWNRLIGLGFLMTAYPAVSLIASFHQWFMSKFTTSISDEFRTRLLAPDDWFNYWRLNCTVVGLHALLNDMPKDYDMENKWEFLVKGEERGVPVSPFLKMPGIVVKHRNEEGGMGIFFYKNAASGGDWIIQNTISNSNWVSTLLPENPPLSTFRVITQSRASLDMSKPPTTKDVTALSCVFRAGRAGAETDHSSILFDVDVKTGLIGGGTTNAHWYRLGLLEILPGRCPWRSHHNYKSHPDGNIPVSGNVVPDIKNLLALVERSHMDLCPRVPFAGWDVVLSDDENLPVCLLEVIRPVHVEFPNYFFFVFRRCSAVYFVDLYKNLNNLLRCPLLLVGKVNLSCNFFRGSFDKKVCTCAGYGMNVFKSFDCTT